MKKKLSKKIILLCVIMFAFLFSSNSQDTIRIKHTNYTTVFSKLKRYPVLIEWWETKTSVRCETPLPRKNKFSPDPSLPIETNLSIDYIGSNIDRGHMCPAASNQCLGEKILTECFYFSNIIPQSHTLNIGSWKTLEILTRTIAFDKDSVHVWCGAVGKIRTFGVHNVTVPSKCWKVIYIKKTKEYRSYIFNNDNLKSDGIENNKVKLSDVEKLTKFKFK
jgi:endonuclease G